MEIKKKELGENILVNLDYKNYKEFLFKVKKLAKEHEYKSNVKKLNYAVVYNGRKRPDMNVKGWTSRVINKNGSIKEVIFIDYDEILWRLVESELKYVQEQFNLSPFYVFKTCEYIDKNGEITGNYLACSLTKKNFREICHILEQTHCDISYKVVPRSYRYKCWVERLSTKGKRPAPEFKCCVGNIKKKYNQDVSQAHLETIQGVFKMPKIKYTNLDGNHEIFLTEYKTASK